MGSKHKALIKNTIIMLVGKIFTQFLSFFMLPLYTYMLPAEEYGMVDLILTYITLLAPVITIQQEMATFRYMIDARGDKEEQAKIISTSLRNVFLRLLCFAVPYVISFIFIPWKYAYLALLCGVVVSFSHLFLQVARGFGNNLQYTVASVLSGIVTIVSNLLLICVFHLGGESILISMALANFVCLAYLFFALKLNRYIRFSASDKKLKKKMLKYSWPLVPNGVSWWLINASDRTIVSIFLGVAANGIYAVANKLPSIISGFLGIFVLSWTESASVHINDDDRDAFFSSVANNTVRIFSSLGILVIAVLPFIFDIIIGGDYREAYVYIPIGVFAVFMNCLVSVYSAIYVAKKMTKQVATTSFIAAVINLVVDLVLIHFIGLYAAVISTAVAYLSMAIYRHYDLKKYVQIRYRVGDLALAVVALVAVSVIYYLGNFWLYVVGVVLAMVYAVGVNRGLVGRAVRKVCGKNKK